MTPDERAQHCRRIASRGGRALVAKYGRDHMSRIGRRGFDVTTERHFGGDEDEHKRWLRAVGAFVYWSSTGIRMKYDHAGRAVWPETKPTHPANPNHSPF
jgi:hypothetical protein